MIINFPTVVRSALWTLQRSGNVLLISLCIMGEFEYSNFDFSPVMSKSQKTLKMLGLPNNLNLYEILFHAT